MIALKLVLLILATICLFLASMNVSAPRINLLALGLTFWVLAIIVG